MKVLLIEKDPISRLYMEASLATLDLQSELAEDAAQAKEILENTSDIRVIVCELSMADQSGLDFCRWVRSRKSEYVYFILYLPADATKANEDEAIEAGVDDFLQKPVNLRDLRIRLHVARRILDSAAHIRELQSLVPICSYCKSVRDDEDYWQRIENYVRERTGDEFTHSVCPACYQAHVVPQLKAMNITPPPLLPTKPKVKRVGT